MTGRIALAANQLSELHGYSIHEQREFSVQWPEPKRIMFIYMRVNRNQTLVIDQYVDGIRDGESIADAEKRLLRNARPGRRLPDGSYRRKDPERWATGFDEVSFGWEPCYVSMVIDDEYWKFHPWPDDGYQETIIFRKNKLIVASGSPPNSKPVVYEFLPNWSFFNFERTEMMGRQSIRFVNFMRTDKEGSPLPEKPVVQDPKDLPKWEYCMDIYIAMPYNFTKNVAPTKWLTLVFDPPQNNGNGN
jgi:hypothetical protein